MWISLYFCHFSKICTVIKAYRQHKANRFRHNLKDSAVYVGALAAAIQGKRAIRTNSQLFSRDVMELPELFMLPYTVFIHHFEEIYAPQSLHKHKIIGHSARMLLAGRPQKGPGCLPERFQAHPSFPSVLKTAFGSAIAEILKILTFDHAVIQFPLLVRFSAEKLLKTFAGADDEIVEAMQI